MTKKNKKKQPVVAPSSAQKILPPKATDDSDEDSSEEDVQVKPQQKAAAKNIPVKSPKNSGGFGTQVVSKVKQGLKRPLQSYESSSEEDDDDDDVDEVPVRNNKAVARKPAGGQTTNMAESSSAEEEDDDSDEEDDDSDEEDDDSDKEETPVKPVQNVTQQKTQLSQQAGAKSRGKNITAEDNSSEEEDDSDDDDDSEDEDEDDSDEEEAPTPVKQISKQKNIPAPQKQVQVDEDDEDEDSSEDEEDDEDSDNEESDSEDDEEEETVTVPESKKRKKASQVSTGKKQKIEQGDSDDDEDEAAKVAESKKRKNKDKTKKDVTAKKQKLEAVNGDKQVVSLFLGNLHKDTTDDDISNFFSENNIKVAEVRKPHKRSNAFADLEDGDDLADALALSGSDLKGKAIVIEKAKPRSLSQEKPQPKDKKKTPSKASGDKLKKGDTDTESRTLFVKHLPDDATCEGLKAIFDSAVDVRIPKKDNAHKGYGFIEFADKDTLEEAVTEKQGVEYNGSSLFLDYMGTKSSHKKQNASPDGRKGSTGFDGNKRQISSGARGSSSVLFVKNISFNTDEAALRAAFPGAVSARIPTFPDSGKSKGFAFVDFKTPDAAAKAFDSMSGQSIYGRQILLDFAADKSSGGGRGGGRGGFSRGGGGGRGGGREFTRGRGRGGSRGGGFQGNRGGFNRGRGGHAQSHGKKAKFDDSD